MEVCFYLFMMLLYVITGGIGIANAIDHFKSKHYVRGGIQVMFAISMIICMAKVVFTW